MADTKDAKAAPEQQALSTTSNHPVPNPFYGTQPTNITRNKGKGPH